MRVALVSMLVLAMAGYASARDAPGRPAKDGWVEKAFDFSDPDLDFKTLVPESAVVETAPLAEDEETEPKQIGRYTNIGKIKPLETDAVPIETTVVGYNLKYAAPAGRLCGRALLQDDFAVVSKREAADASGSLTEGVKEVSGRPKTGVISHCLTRGYKALAIHFIYDLSKADGDGARDEIVDYARDYSMTFIDNMVFSAARGSSYWEGVKNAKLIIDGEAVNVRMPEPWDLPINTFDGRKEARFFTGGLQGAVWFSSVVYNGRPDLEMLSTSLLPRILQGQNQAFGEVTKAYGKVYEPSPTGALTGIFRYSVKAWDNDDYGHLLVRVVWHEGMLYIVDYWWPFKKNDQHSYFSALPAISIYDNIADILEERFVSQAQ
ncbi:hypothetical protein GAO09_27390 [Rhizobiales bacterium RZME27]|uniref:Uncharacterized protein n=1 Tax=Endobacterium cereale TaxID=2663029 RepID=A0A6A8AKQ8_9HYPH|nr:hypothetical protein [Endobacterium cereale]MEB2842988.1 hypothetical protein [Endobacterium cereale]MQY49756.1 hypothetical protein [Endobacterium cereale]